MSSKNQRFTGTQRGRKHDSKWGVKVIETDPKMTYMLELAEKDIKTFI